MPDFAHRSEPIRKLLSKPHLPWTPEHSNCVKGLCQRILSGIPLLNFNPADPLRIEIHAGPAGLACTLLQKDPATSRHLPIASYARTWAEKEPYSSILELETTAIQESLSKLSHYTAFAHTIELPCSDAFHALMRLNPRLHPKLQAQLLDIQAYRPALLPEQSVLPAELAWDASDRWGLATPDEDGDF